MPMMSMLDRVILRAADDETFRKALLSDPDEALASMDYALDDHEYAVIDEYRRVASAMSDQQQSEASRGYSADNGGHAFA